MDIQGVTTASIGCWNEVGLSTIFPGDMTDKLLIEDSEDGFLVVIPPLGKTLQRIKR